MPNVLITGSNRGLGIEWVRQYADEGWRVFATCRRPTEAVELNDLAVSRKNVTVHPLDVIKTDGINALAVELMKEPIDVLINNAGVYLEKYYEVGLGKMKYDDWQYTFKVNTLGPVRIIEAFRDHVAQSTRRLVVVISTHMASITDIVTPGAYYYRSTKAALNAVMEGLTHELKQKDVRGPDTASGLGQDANGGRRDGSYAPGKREGYAEAGGKFQEGIFGPIFSL